MHRPALSDVPSVCAQPRFAGISMADSHPSLPVTYPVQSPAPANSSMTHKCKFSLVPVQNPGSEPVSDEPGEPGEAWWR
jgi:hypothetical protein